MEEDIKNKIDDPPTILETNLKSLKWVYKGFATNEIMK